MSSNGPWGFLRKATGRSLLPLAALAVIAGTLIWGPLVSLLLAYACWRAVGRYA